MKKIVKISMIACLAVAFFACEDKKSEEAPYFGVEAKFLTQTFGPAAETKYVTVKTNQAYTATSSAAWCTTEILANETEENLKISVNALDVVTPRTATVTVACQGFSNAVITVTQNGVQATLNVTPAEPETIEGTGGDVVFTVAANADWTYSIPTDATWLTKSAETATSLTLTAETNPESAGRTANVTFSLTDYPDVTQTIEVSQAAGFQPELTVTPSSLSIVKTGGGVTFTVTANADWEYTAGNWLTETEKTSTTLTLTAGRNPQIGGRGATVTFTLKDYPSYTRSFSVGQTGEADMLDVIFNPDGSATDLSPMLHTIKLVHPAEPSTLSVAADAAYGRNIVTFAPAANGSGSASHYRIDYSSGTEFANKLADGHSFECLVKFDVNYGVIAPTYETKFFSTHQSGGTGFLISTSSHTSGANGITFLPNVPAMDGGGSNWIWTNSQIKPDGQSYYHLVGVWNQTEGKAYLYVNGELKSEVPAAGFYRPQNLSPQWLAIGGDAGSNIEGPYQGKMVIARIYDKPLTASEAEALYNEINPTP
ncbi:MAG: hypothetical protein LBF89_05445 [Bacteroidales bacterium]|jgi:hypothetical protein|nr:hypothetical protein [Bacteroidales bacterium]